VTCQIKKKKRKSHRGRREVFFPGERYRSEVVVSPEGEVPPVAKLNVEINIGKSLWDI
jgi:hypothetical protein